MKRQKYVALGALTIVFPIKAIAIDDGAATTSTVVWTGVDN